MESLQYFLWHFAYGCKDALMGGFLIIAMRLLFCTSNKDTLQTFGKWALIYAITGLLLTMTALLVGFFILHRIPYYTNGILYCAVSAVALLYVFKRSSKLEQFICSSLFLYAITILQGVQFIDILANLYAMTAEISIGLLLECFICFLIGYIPFVMGISVVMSLINQRFPKSRNVFLILLVVVCLGKGILPLLDIHIF